MEGLRAGRQTDGSGWFDTVLRRTPARLTTNGSGAGDVGMVFASMGVLMAWRAGRTVRDWYAALQ